MIACWRQGRDRPPPTPRPAGLAALASQQAVGRPTGMLVVETVSRAGYLVKSKSIREIARDLRISHNTVRKVLRSGLTSFETNASCSCGPSSGVERRSRPFAAAQHDEGGSRAPDVDPRVRGTARPGLGRRQRRCSPLRPNLGENACGQYGSGLPPALLRTWRGLPVRLEPRQPADRQHDGDRKGQRFCGRSRRDPAWRISLQRKLRLFGPLGEMTIILWMNDGRIRLASSWRPFS